MQAPIPVMEQFFKGVLGAGITISAIIAFLIPILLLILAWRFVKAHEEIAKSLRTSGQSHRDAAQAHRETAVALRKLIDIQSNKENKQP